MVKNDVKQTSSKFVKECVEIDLFAAGLYTHEVISSLDTDEQLIQAHLFLLLQIVCMEYTEIFQQLIDYYSGGDALMIKEQVDKAFDITLAEGFG